ncbi:metal-dependent amidase/aminoacylase/carboxypeptidase family protein [Bradyrhizobium sp. LB7.1]
MPIVNRVADLQPDIQAWRRDIHEHPELLYDVHRTRSIRRGSPARIRLR